MTRNSITLFMNVHKILLEITVLSVSLDRETQPRGRAISKTLVGKGENTRDVSKKIASKKYIRPDSFRVSISRIPTKL